MSVNKKKTVFEIDREEDKRINNVFRKSVESVLKEMNMTKLDFCDKTNYPYESFRKKLSEKSENFFTLRECLLIADELGEYLEDLCSGELLK